MSGQKDWKLKINVAGVSPSGVFIDLPTGAYLAKIIGSELSTEGKGSVRFDLLIDDGEFKGAPQSVTVGTDLSKEGNLRHWKALMLSAGFTEAQIGSGEVSIGASSFNNKKAHIFVQQPPEGELTTDGKQALADRKFITAEMAKSLAGMKPTARRSKNAGGTEQAPKGDFEVKAGSAPNGTTAPAPQTPQPSAGEMDQLLA